MKRVTLIGGLVLLLMVIVAVVAALNMGEKSPIFAAGTIEVSPELAQEAQDFSTLFVIVFDPDSPMPMPLGAMKERLKAGLNGSYSFLITKESMLRMAMGEDPTHHPKYLRLKARLDKDGSAGADQPGDLVGIIENVPFGSEDVKIRIDRKIP